VPTGGLGLRDSAEVVVFAPFAVMTDETPTYVLSTTYTQQGVDNVRDGPKRTDHAREMVEAPGGTWRDFFVTVGRYDGVVIADFPDDKTAARAALALAEPGSVTTGTLRAFTLDEFRDVVEATS
jgi:uncharacterized protein with GYD domain